MSLSSKTSFHHNMLPHHKEMLVDILLIQLPICQILYFLLNTHRHCSGLCPHGLLHGPL